MTYLQVHVLRFSDTQAMRRAFGDLNDNPDVESCVVEPEVCQIRIMAEPKVSDAVIQRLYEDGGLVWCSRHALEGS